MITYLHQLEKRAVELRLDLSDVCALEGVAATTLTRWRNGKAACREGTAQRLFARMKQMARERDRPGVPAPVHATADGKQAA